MRRLACLAACASALLWIDVPAQTTAQTSDGPAAAAPLPIEHFTKFNESGGIKVSPDAASIAVLTGKYGRSTLAVVDLKDAKVVGGFRVPDDCEIDEYYWISPQQLIYTIAQRQPGEITPTATGEIFVANRDGSGNRRLYGYRAQQKTIDTHIKVREASYATAELLSPLEREPNFILIAEYPWRMMSGAWYYNPDARPIISRLDVRNGNKKKVDVAPLAGAALLLDRDDNVRFAFGRNEHQKFAVSWKPQPDSEWTGFELAGFRDESVVPQLFSSDNRSVYLTGVREGEKYDALYRLDLETQQLTKVHGFEGADIYGVITDFADREIVGMSAYADRRTDVWLVADDPATRLYQALQRAFPQQHVSVPSTSEDGRMAIVFVHADVNPGDYYLFDTQTLRADFLRAGRAWIDPKQMRPKEPIKLQARDGLELHGYVTRPAGDGPHPMVVMPHGGPHGVRDWWDFDWEVQLLANRGYAVLQVNYRGSRGYGMDFELAGFGEWGTKVQDDITDATRWAIEQKIAPPDRICIYGISFGGFASLMGAAREPDLYRCAIGYGGVYDLELMWESGDIPRSRYGRSYLEEVIGRDKEKLRAQSPVHNAQNIKAPVLLIHGKADWRAAYEQAQRMKAALEKNQKKAQWLALSREGHTVYDEDTRREVYERILQFLDANLKAPQSTLSRQAGPETP